MPNRSQLLSLDYYLPLAFNAVRIGVILLLAYIAVLVVKRLERALYTYTVLMVRKRGGAPEYELEKRAQTIGAVVRRSLIGLIWSIALIMILEELNFDVRPLLAGAGIAGVALGFGAQSLVRDVISGLFMLIENQIRVNDVAVINGTGGLVEEINLRTTVLRDESGAVHIFPNGAIQKLSNLTREYSFYVFSLSVPYKVDTDHLTAEMKQIGEEIVQEEPYKSLILAPLEIMGVDQLGDALVTLKARIKTLPSKQWIVGREMNRRIKKRIQEAEIEMPLAPHPAPAGNILG
jgi:small-conductance mechanosensitive channel